LAKLRWGATKSLQYRGDGQDATVRLLAAPALIHPLDSKNPSAESPEALTRRFLIENKNLLLIDDPASEFVVSSSEPDQQGGTVLRLGQRFGKYEVWPGQITFNVSAYGYLRVLSGTYSPTPKAVLTIPRIAAEAAQNAALAYTGLSNQPAALSPVAPQLKIFADKGRTPELSYEVFVEFGQRHERVFVSAQSGEILHSVSEICTGATFGSGTDIFGQTRSLNISTEGSPTRYNLVDKSKAMYNAATDDGVIAIIDMATENPSYSTNQLAGYDSEGVSASYNLSKAYDFFLTNFGRNSFDGDKSSIIALIRVTNPDGSPMYNAFWNPHNKLMGFGTADRFTGATDVVGHEFTHAVCSSTAKLLYQYESGAIDESISDMLGESLERSVYGSNDWLVGSFLDPENSSGGALRDMRSPEAKNHPSKMSRFLRTEEDHGGVHTNSGIPNHAFYLMAEGLPGGAIGLDAARNIIYRTLVTKLNPNSSFLDLRLGCILSAEELFGKGSVEVTKVRAAFDAVEIFDAGHPGMPEDLTPPAGPDSYLLTYKAVDGNYYLGRRESAFGDGSGVTAISNQSVDPDSRPSVSGDGSTAVFTSANHDLVVAETNGAGSESLGLIGRVHSASISADAKHVVIIFRDPETGLPIHQIAHINIETEESVLIPLYLPVVDGGTALEISTIDEIDVSPDGQTAIFDGLAETTLANGVSFRGWSVFAVDLKTKQIVSLAGPFEDFDIGNPSFARTSSNRLLLEAFAPESSAIFALDLYSESSAIVKSYDPPSDFFAYPRFSAADDFVVFTDEYFSLSTLTYSPRVARMELQSDHITPVGSATVLQNLARNGLSYRRGAFAGSPVLSVSTSTLSVQGGATGSFRVSRVSGDQNVRVPFSFKTLGTAKPDTDYSRITTTAEIAPGVNYVDIQVAALMPPLQPSRTLTLSLDPQVHYLLSNPGDSSTITLVSPPLTFSYWASGYGAGASTDDDDRDGLTNFLEYVLGTNPKSASGNYAESELIEAGLQRFIQLRVARSQIVPGLSWTLQRSADRSTWSTAAYAIVANTDSELILRDSLPLSINETRYLRIQFSDSIGTATTASLGRANLSLGNLTQVYNGTPRSVSVTGVPNGFTPTITYDDSFTPPTNAGYYLVNATIDSNGLIAEATEILAILPAAQTIGFTMPYSATYGQAPIVLSATASSGLPVTLSVESGPGLISNSTLSLIGAGTVVVSASQDGNENYAAAESVFQAVIVSKASQTITFNPPSSVPFSGSATNLSATASSGLQVAFSVLSGPGTLNGSLLTVTGPGSIMIRSSQAGDTNYNAAAPVERTITVANAPQNITFAPIADRTFNPPGNTLTLSASATSGLAVNFSVTSGPATVSGNTLTIAGAGSVTVQASQAGNADYASASATRTFTIAKAPQTIAFAAPADRPVGSPAFNLAATATSGLPVTFSVSGPASLAGTTLTLSGTTGTVTVTASQAGNSNYNPATSVERTFTVSAAPQTINFTPIDNRTFNPAANTLALSATASSGLSPVTFTVTSGPAAIVGSTLTITGAGSITVQASQAGNANYGAASASRTFNVAKASQTIVFTPPFFATYGNAPLALSATADSGLPVTLSVSSGPGSMSGSTLSLTGAGIVGITATQPGNANYSPAVAVPKTINVGKAPLTISAKNVSRVVGAANPVLPLSYAGLIGADGPATALTSIPVAATKATAKSAPGSYPITLTGGASNNYTLTLVPGSLTVVGFGGTYEALLLGAASVPVGKLTFTIPPTTLTYTGTLTLAREAKSITVASTSKSPGTTAFVGSADLANAAATWTRTTNGVDALSLALTVSTNGSVAGSLKRNGEPFATLARGARLRTFAKGQTAPGAGANTLALHSAYNLFADGPLPGGSGFATVPIAPTTGVLTLKGFTADGSPLTASLKPTLDDTYLLWVNPYGTRANSFLAGALRLQAHPESARFPGRAYVPRDAGLLTWQKAALPANTATAKLDKSYRAGFGPLGVEVSLDPWLPPSARAVGSIPAGTLAQRLGLAANGALSIAHGPEELDLGARETLMPFQATLSPAGVLTATNAANTAWTIKITPTTGAFTGGFTLRDPAPTATKPSATVDRKVTFSGVLRQAPTEESEVATGFFLVPGLPVPKGAAATEQPSGEIRFSAP
jgi:Zn-dependent metalloprotease